MIELSNRFSDFEKGFIQSRISTYNYDFRTKNKKGYLVFTSISKKINVTYHYYRVASCKQCNNDRFQRVNSNNKICFRCSSTNKRVYAR